VGREPLAIMKFRNSNVKRSQTLEYKSQHASKCVNQNTFGGFEACVEDPKSVLSVKDSLINVLLHHRAIQLIPLMTSDSNNGSRV